jgi:hypothetical protein
MDVIRPEMPLLLRLVTRVVLRMVGLWIRARGLTEGEARPPYDLGGQAKPDAPAESATSPAAK